MRDAVIASGDASELLELADGSLNAISELVFGGIEGPFAGHACALGNDRLGAAGLDMVEDGVGIVGFVSDDIIGLETGQQRDRQPCIADVAPGQNKAHGTAERIDRDVPLGGQSASGAPQSLVAEPPFWPVAAWAWARTIELSIIRYSLSRSPKTR